MRLPLRPLHIELMRMRSFDFTSLLSGSSIPYFTLVDRVNAIQYRSGALVIRVHDIEMSTVPKDTQAVYLALVAEAFTPSDPPREFFGPTHATIILEQGTQEGICLVVDMETPLPPFLTLRMSVQAGSIDSEPFRFTISASVVFRESKRK
jgi:hypothetical protein